MPHLIPRSLPPGFAVCDHCGTPLTQPYMIEDDGHGARQIWTFNCSCGLRISQSLTYQFLAQAVGQFYAGTEREPEPPEPPRVISGSVIGYRAWRIVNWQLYGTGVDRAWSPGIQEATCDMGLTGLPAMTLALSQTGPPHAAPHAGCHCGINALARFDQGDGHWAYADVFGAIEAWGETDGDPDTKDGGFHLHRNGFRARYAKVVLLAVEDDWPAAKRAAVRALAREHEADVCKREHLEDAAKEHGQLVPDELLEWVAKTEPQEHPYSSPYSYLAYQPSPIPRASAKFSPSIISGSGRPQKSKPAKPGISQTLGYPGPPANPTTKYRKGQRVADSKAVIWTCIKGGKPGCWEREA